MLIKKFIKKKNSWYDILLEDGRKFLIHEELILKYKLLITKDIDELTEEKILKENNIFFAYDKALKYITRKMRSVFEIESYLYKLEIEENIINQVILKLNSLGYLNDREYAKCYVNDSIYLSNDGPNKIIFNLKKNKISDEIITEVIDVFDYEKQEEKVNKLIQKHIKSNTNKSLNFLKQKIVVNLVNLGYDRQLIINLLENYDIDDKEIFEKEYRKLYEKLSKKYSGKELEYRLKQKLYQKGFHI